MKQNKGITLVALIITIIVMLVLVVTTVSILINSNVIGKAKDATKRTETAYNNESNFGEELTINVGGETFTSIDEAIGGDKDLDKLNEFFGQGMAIVGPEPPFNRDIDPIPDADTSIIAMKYIEPYEYIVYSQKMYKVKIIESGSDYEYGLVEKTNFSRNDEDIIINGVIMNLSCPREYREGYRILEGELYYIDWANETVTQKNYSEQFINIVENGEYSHSRWKVGDLYYSLNWETGEVTFSPM